MSKKSKKARKPQPRPKIHVPEGLATLFGQDLVTALKKRVDRKHGACAVCKNRLGQHQLAFVAELHEGDIRGWGDWQVATTHRACRREEVKHNLTLIPQRTYTTALVALPIPQTDSTPQYLPTLLVNPSVDHFVVHVSRDGDAYDRTEEFLTKDCGFTRMEDDAPPPQERTLTAYITGANFLVAHGESGQQWEHRTVTDPENSDRLADSIREIVTAWDGLLVMASHKFKTRDPLKLLENVPELIQDGHVLAAVAAPEFRAPEHSLVDQAFKMARSPLLDRAHGGNSQSTTEAPSAGATIEK